MLWRLFGHGLALTLPNLSLKFDLPQCGACKDVEKIGAISALDSVDRDFTRRLRAAGEGN
jgi:hypothetical protein